MSREDNVKELVKVVGASHNTTFNDVSNDGVYYDGFLYLRLIRFPKKGSTQQKEVDLLKSLYGMLIVNCKDSGDTLDVVEENFTDNIPYIVYT